MAENETEKLNIPYPILVEGKYDRQKIAVVTDAPVLTTEGFGIFKNAEKKAFLRALSEKTKILVLTDSDGAGRLIRAHLHGVVPPDRIIEVYIPPIPGKERRKDKPSREGLLGVEGMSADTLRRLLSPYAAGQTAAAPVRPLTKTDLYCDGLTGGENSAGRRDALCRALALPEGMTPNALLTALNLLCTYEEYCRLVGRTK